MKNFLLFLSIAFISLFVSCTEDFGTTTVTYTKATAQYGDIEAIRNTPLTGSVREIVNPGKIFISDNTLLIGEEGVGIHILDNSDPENPRQMSFINIPSNREFYVSDNVIYAESLYDFLSIDISDLNNPTIRSRSLNAFSQEFVNLDGQTLIGFDYEIVTETMKISSDTYSLLDEGNSISYYDYANKLIPPSAVPASFAGNSQSARGSVNRITEYQGFVYVVSRSELHVFDTHNELEHVFSDWGGNDMETVYPLDNRLYIGARSSMEVFNIEDPRNPVKDFSFWHETSCDPVFPVDETTAYVTLRTGDVSNCPGDNNELLVLDVTSNFATTIQSFEMSSPYGLTLIEDRLFVGEGDNGLHIFDATDRRNLRPLKHDHSVNAYDVLAHPVRSDLLLIAGPEGLSQYKIGEQQQLLFVSEIAY